VRIRGEILEQSHDWSTPSSANGGANHAVGGREDAEDGGEGLAAERAAAVVLSLLPDAVRARHAQPAAKEKCGVKIEPFTLRKGNAFTQNMMFSRSQNPFS
jgi:hypothetical protein